MRRYSDPNNLPDLPLDPPYSEEEYQKDNAMDKLAAQLDPIYNMLAKVAKNPDVLHDALFKHIWSNYYEKGDYYNPEDHNYVFGIDVQYVDGEFTGFLIVTENGKEIWDIEI